MLRLPTIGKPAAKRAAEDDVMTPNWTSELRTVRACESERMPMSDRLAELLKLASNDSGDTSDDKPPGVRVGDILSNGWASNRNPLKLFMYLGMSHDSFRGINIDGKSAGPVRKGNAVKIVLPRDTPDYWRTWELLAKQLPLLYASGSDPESTRP